MRIVLASSPQSSYRLTPKQIQIQFRYIVAYSRIWLSPLFQYILDPRWVPFQPIPTTNIFFMEAGKKDPKPINQI